MAVPVRSMAWSRSHLRETSFVLAHQGIHHGWYEAPIRLFLLHCCPGFKRLAAFCSFSGARDVCGVESRHFPAKTMPDRSCEVGGAKQAAWQSPVACEVNGRSRARGEIATDLGDFAGPVACAGKTSLSLPASCSRGRTESSEKELVRRAAGTACRSYWTEPHSGSRKAKNSPGLRHELECRSRATMRGMDSMKAAFPWLILLIVLAGPQMNLNRCRAEPVPGPAADEKDLQPMLDRLNALADLIARNPQAPEQWRYLLEQGELLLQVALRSQGEERDHWLRMALESYYGAAVASPVGEPTACQRLAQLPDIIARALPGSPFVVGAALQDVRAEYMRDLAVPGTVPAQAQQRHCRRLAQLCPGVRRRSRGAGRGHGSWRAERVLGPARGRTQFLPLPDKPLSCPCAGTESPGRPVAVAASG